MIQVFARIAAFAIPVVLPAAACAVDLLDVKQTPFLRKGDNGYENLVHATFRGGDGTSVTIATTARGVTVDAEVLVASGDAAARFLVPAVDAPLTATIVLSGADKTSTRTPVLLQPVKKWKIFAVPSIHVDIGYTDGRADVIRRHLDNMDRVVRLCREDPDFRWNIEVSWELQSYMENRSTSETKLLFDLMRQGRIGLHAGYLNMLTALMGDEAMNRYALHSARLARRENFRTKTLILSDVPTATGALPSVLAASGIRYFAEGCNMDRGPMLRNSGYSNPFWWEGPDGARVLAYFSMHYARTAWMAECPTLDCFEEHVPRMIEPLRADYPSDAVYLYGAFLDNRPFNDGFMKFMKPYSERWAYPEIRVATSDEFFEYLEKDCGDKLEVKRADFGAFWEDGAGSTAQETALHMESQRRIVAAETLFSLAALANGATPYPTDRIEQAWQDILFYNEHTWGAADSIHKPDAPLTVQQWREKATFAHRAHALTQSLLDDGLQAYAATVAGTEKDIVVVNSLSFSRGGLVDITEAIMAAPEATRALKTADGRHVPVQRSGSRLWAYVPEIPPLGHLVLKPGGATTKAATIPNSDQLQIQNQFYRITGDSTKGISSIVDLETGKELVNEGSPWGIGQVVYALGGENTKMIHDHATTPAQFIMQAPLAGSRAPSPAAGEVHVYPARITAVEGGTSGPLFSELVVESTAPSMENIRVTLRLHNLEKRISLDVDVTSKTEERRKEAVYVAFPFAAEKPGFRLGMTNTVADPAKDFSRFGCHEWYCVQDFVACKGADGTEVLWTSPDAPLVTLAELNKGTWKQEPELTTATVFSYLMNNYWHTNYKAGQGGDFRFRYNLTSNSGSTNDTDRLKFARSSANPPLAVKASTGAEPVIADASPIPILVEGDGVLLTTLRRATNGEGHIIRLRNVKAEPATVRLSQNGKAVKYQQVNMVEAELAPPAAVSDQPLHLQARQTVTLRIP